MLLISFNPERFVRSHPKLTQLTSEAWIKQTKRLTARGGRGSRGLLHQVFPVSQVGNSPACFVVWMDYLSHAKCRNG
jgi:hypothetical protein